VHFFSLWYIVPWKIWQPCLPVEKIESKSGSAKTFSHLNYKKTAQRQKSAEQSQEMEVKWVLEESFC
jgi:hypothetical protein